MRRKSRPPRHALILLSCVLAVPTVFCILYGTPQPHKLHLLLAVGALLGIAHLLLRPLLRLITAPLGCLTLGLSGTIIDIALIYLSAALVQELPAPDLLYALLTALMINTITFFAGARR